MLALLKMLLPINSIFQLMLIIIKLQSMSASIWCKDLKGKVLFSLPPLVKEYLFIHSPTTLRDLVKLHSCMLSWITEIVWQPVEPSVMQVNLDSYPIFKEASALLFMTECSSLTMELECHSEGENNSLILNNTYISGISRRNVATLYAANKLSFCNGATAIRMLAVTKKG